MSQLTIPDELFERLARRAAALNVTVEQLIAPALDFAAQSSQESSLAAKPSLLDAWLADVDSRAGRYPPGFVMDDSRESIYQGCGE
jgi:hypothetical protein